LALQNYCHDLLKRHGKILLLKKGVDRVILSADIIAYAFVGVSLSDAKYMGGEYLNELYKVIY